MAMERSDLCQEVFGETEVAYTKPTTRLRGHLADYDPSKAPTFRWPERLVKLGDEIRLNAIKKRATHAGYETKVIEGWAVIVSERLLRDEPKETERALELLQTQLKDIVRVVPAKSVTHLRKVPLWFSPEYSGTAPRAEYHPSVDWLRKNDRKPEMARCVEFSNIRIFERETKRMPLFVLHELAHAFHDQVLNFENAEIKAAFQRIVEDKSYESVERTFGDPARKNSTERAYALSNEKEYFAETSEAFFGQNDFFPFNRRELEKHDPGMLKLLQRLWGVAE